MRSFSLSLLRISHRAQELLRATFYYTKRAGDALRLTNANKLEWKLTSLLAGPIVETAPKYTSCEHKK